METQIETKEPIEIQEQDIESKLPIEMTMEDEKRWNLCGCSHGLGMDTPLGGDDPR